MAGDQPHRLTRYLRGLVATAATGDASDGRLVEQFHTGRDGAALTALVRRHGSMVYHVCRRVLRNEQDAEDAFQATFLVLTRKAHTLRAQESVGSWLYGVAYRTALKARTAAARRGRREAAAPPRGVAEPLAELTVHEAQTIVDQELARLPDKYRAPLVLCCLEGRTRDEAAQQLGWPLGLLKSRLEQARELLRDRLARRGMTLTAGLFSAALLGGAAQAGPAPALIDATVRAAVLVASGGPAGTVVSAQVLALSAGVARALAVSKLKVVAAVLLVASAVLGASGVLAYRRAATPGPPATAPAPRGAENNRMADTPPLPTQEGLERWGQAEVLFTARLDRAEAGPVARSDPPVHTHQLHLRVEKVLRGALKEGGRVTAFSSVRQREAPVFPVGKGCLVAGKNSRGRLVVAAVVEATAETLGEAERACAVPVGWALEEGRLVSPWAKFGKSAWPRRASAKARYHCAATGRPALLAGEGVEFTVEPVPPKAAVKYANPDGDGEYTVTVKNVTARPVTVPALLSDGSNLLWAESLVILCQGKAYPTPGAQGVRRAPKPSVLKPGQAVSTVVNVLALQGPDWPRGGARVELQFALGERSVTQSFYYLSRHHDPLRERAAQGPATRRE